MPTTSLNAPDITLAQILAAVTWLGTQLVTMGVADETTTKLAVSVGVTIVTAAWAIADSIIRQGRAKAIAPAVAAGKAEVTSKIVG